MFLKSMFLVHTIHSTIDVESLPHVLTAIRNEITKHPNITLFPGDDTNGKMRIAYAVP